MSDQVPTTIKAYVLSGAGDADVCTWLEKFAGAEIVDKLIDCNLVVFVGGADVTPGMYGEKRLPCSQTNYLRDMDERRVFDFCRQCGIPMFGICRGSQFLHACMHGKIWQDVTSHAIGSNPGHPMIDVDTGETLQASSYHHQMVRMEWEGGGTPEEHGFELVAKAPDPISDYYFSEEGKLCTDAVIEVEAYRYPSALIFAMQGHPEWGPEVYARWAGVKVAEWHGKLHPVVHLENAIQPKENTQCAA